MSSAVPAEATADPTYSGHHNENDMRHVWTEEQKKQNTGRGGCEGDREDCGISAMVHKE
jgi:hypothetical protein